jgi:folate-binding protein YgfZ
LRVSGPDAAGFLQGQFTNDLAKGGAVYGLWLNVKGKVLADSFVLRGPGADEYWIGSYFSSAAAIKERLESFIIADDVVVEDVTAEWEAITIFGRTAADAFTALRINGFIFRGRRGASEATEWVYPRGQRAAVAAALGSAGDLQDREVTRRRIEAGIPAVPQDIGPGELPNEGGLEADAISYTKGCYLGQEVMARLKSMGQVRRRLVRVAGAGARVPTLPAPLFVGPKQVGELRSAVQTADDAFVGLALVSRLNLGSATGVALAANSPATITLRDEP